MFNLLFLLLLALRFWELGLKPVHHDESINGWFVMQNWAQGFYTYDPSNYHGPLLFYLFQVGEVFGGSRIQTYRFITTLFSVLTLLWISRWALRRLNLNHWMLWGLALSPGFLFFSRSAIHEPIFVFFTAIAATSAIDFFIERQKPAVWGVVLGSAGMALVKETFVIPVGIIFLFGICSLMSRSQRKYLWQERGAFLKALLVGALLVCAFYSGFGARPSGLFDFVGALVPWLKTGTSGGGHDKSFWYFLDLISAYETASLVALGVTVFGLIWGGLRTRVVSAWALLILLVYSWVPYKTPWCLISIQAPLWIAALYFLSTRTRRIQQTAAVVFLIVTSMNLRDFWSLNFTEMESHPYIYVQSTYRAKEFVLSLQKQVAEKPELARATVQWGGSEAWPFPWWLQEFQSQTTVTVHDQVLKDGDLYLIDEEDQNYFEPQIQGDFLKSTFLVRDSRVKSIVYLREGLFQCPFSECERFHR